MRAAGEKSKSQPSHRRAELALEHLSRSTGLAALDEAQNTIGLIHTCTLEFIPGTREHYARIAARLILEPLNDSQTAFQCRAHSRAC